MQNSCFKLEKNKHFGFVYIINFNFQKLLLGVVFFMKKNLVKTFFVNFAIIFMSVLCFGMTIFNPISIKNTPCKECSKTFALNLPSLKQIVQTLFKKEPQQAVETKEKVYVYLGGQPLGFRINSKGVIVVAKSNDSAKMIEEGDILLKIEDIEVTSATQILSIINSENYIGRTLNVTIKRGDDEFVTTILPKFDEQQNTYKLGLWIRDNAAGVGTLTYVRTDNLRYGALGHPVCDIDTGTCLPVKNDSGNIYKCNIVGLKKGSKGNPGELRGLFLRNGSMLGTLDQNNKFGVYGNFNNNYVDYIKDNIVEVASRNEIRSGKAQIRCTIDGNTPKYYDIEIVKTYFQSSKDNKSMFIRVTDKELISKTGGIVQGMSGSPIIQNGKLIGAVTHVFVSDSTKGYGVYADWMIDN